MKWFGAAGWSTEVRVEGIVDNHYFSYLWIGILYEVWQNRSSL